MKRVALILALSLAAAPAVAQPRAVAIDGDTLTLGGERIRVMGLDAPEMHGRCPRETALAARARDRLQQLVAGGIWLQRRGRDQYGRTLAVVLDSTGADVAVILISEGLARPYDGRGQRRGWCDG